ncbi:hypothetical protein EJB05_48481, partial [Eragrostis curvula]
MGDATSDDPMPQFDPQEMNRWSIDLQFGGEQKQLWSDGGGSGGSSFAKIARAVPKAESLEDASVGAQKFRVKLEPGPTDMLCQIALDGIRMLGPGFNYMVQDFSRR